MSDWSYKGSNVEYRDKRHTYFESDEEPVKNKKKKEKKKNKRSKHKHEYIPAIYIHYINYEGEHKQRLACGDHCKICGRVRNFGYNWYTAQEDRISIFKEQYPDYVEIELPETWDCFKNKYIPI